MKDGANTKMEKQLLLEFLAKMDKSERCGSSHIRTSQFGLVSESVLTKKLNDLQLLGLAGKFRKIISFLRHG